VTIEQQRFRMDEVLHEVRSSVAGIAAATRLLHGGHTRLRGDAGRRLESLLEAELRRLEKLLGEPVDGAAATPLTDTVDDVVLSHRIRGVDVRWQTQPCGMVECPWEVREVLHILLDNAARHAPGATVTITAERSDGWTEIRVADDGPGVPAELAEEVFARGARREGSTGQGLGLHMARQLLVDVGGMIRLDVTGSGAAFVIAVPVD
jgi:signal transduction histidine kinase